MTSRSLPSRRGRPARARGRCISIETSSRSRTAFRATSCARSRTTSSSARRRSPSPSGWADWCSSRCAPAPPRRSSSRGALATFEAWRQATGIRIIDGIGATEMLHIFISAAGDDIRPGATGRVVPGYEAHVVDADGNPLPPGTIGRLAVRGPTGCRYLDDEERQRAYVQRGWNITGDTYVMDDDVYFWYQARTDDMIISGGYNISGPEVEGVLLEHPSVSECAVVGVPDAERGQVVKAFVILRSGAEASDATTKALQDWAKSQIAPYKYPRRIAFVDALPRTATGKLQRYRLREQEALSAAAPTPERGGSSTP